MKDKKILIILSLLTVFLIGIFLVLFLSKKESAASQYILSTFPQDKDENAPTNAPIRITFQKNAVSLLSSITLTPSLDYLQTRSEDNVYLTPKNGLKANARYTIQVYFKDTKDSYAFSFKTGKTTIGSQGPDTIAVEQHEKQQRETRPDLFLSNKVPHKEFGFSITSFYDATYKQFSFAVVLLGENKEKSKSDLQKWLKSLKLTGQQIDSLHFVYISEAVEKLKGELPFDGKFFGIDYDKDKDQTTIYIFKKSQSQGEKELDEFLKKKGILDKSEINNLTVLYI